MSFNTTYRLSVHAVIFNQSNEVLLLKQTYHDHRWGLPGGAVDQGESVVEALYRECKEELQVDIDIDACTGVYHHPSFNSHALLFRCQIPPNTNIKLSEEHSDYKWFPLEELGEVQRIRVEDALNDNRMIASGIFHKNPMDP